MTTPTTVLHPNTYTLCPTALIVASLTNRKHFAPEPLQALSDNIKARGIDQPIIVRALPGARLAETFDAPKGMPKPAYEIVSGERRFRAADMAGLSQVPVILRVYSDVQAIEAQLIENMLRESLSELDEAEGFEAWLQQPGITTTIIATKTEKSLRYIQSRLQLLKLQPETKTALRTNQIEVSQALLLAPVHDPKLQLKALEFAKTTPSGGTKPSVRELAVWLRQNVMLDLARAPFQITAANLVPLAGSCKSCPKRTGADPDMFSHVDGADICTDPPCYNTKADAHLAELQHQADKRGMRLVHGPEAKAICYEKSSTLNGYSPLSQVRNDLAAPHAGKRLDHLLSPSPTVPITGAVLIENPHTKELIAAIPTAEAEAALVAKGLVKVIDAVAPKIEADKAKGKKDVEADIAKLKANADLRVKARYEELLDAKLTSVLASQDADDLAGQFMPALLRVEFSARLQYTTGQQAFAALGIKTKDLEKLSSAEIYQVCLLCMALEDGDVANVLAKQNGIDLGALKHKAADEIKAEVAAQIAALKKPAKTPSPKSPLAQPSTTPVADAENSKPKTAKPKAQAKAKLSAKDAQLGIADALQGIEAPPADGAVPIHKAFHKFDVGQQVKVKPCPFGNLPLHHEKYIGKTGTVTEVPFGLGLIEVTFKGRTGGVADFKVQVLEAA